MTLEGSFQERDCLTKQATLSSSSRYRFTMAKLISHKFIFLVLVASLLHPMQQNGNLWSQKLETSCRCGEREARVDSSESINLRNYSRIVGGVDAEPGSEKWMAFINARETLCTGSLINSRLVLTAAHCMISEEDGSVIPPEKLQVWLNRRSGPEEPADSQSELHLAERIILHPEHQSNRFDVAIIVLKDEINFHASKVRPICLPDVADNFELPGRKDGIAFGYGRIDPGTGYEVPTNLQQGNVAFVQVEQCLNNFNYVIQLIGDESEPQLTSHDVDTYICSPGQINDELGATFVFQGDSGGPVTLPLAEDDSTVRMIQMGVASATDAHLIQKAQQHDPSLTYMDAVVFYTDIFKILPFIDSVDMAVDATWCAGTVKE